MEVYYNLGLIEESEKYAKLLGYNYQSSEWYKNSYVVFNKNYKKEENSRKKNKNNSILKKIKSLID